MDGQGSKPLHNGEGPLQVTSAACNTKEVIPQGLPELPARCPVCPGNEVFSVLLSWLFAASLREKMPKEMCKEMQKSKFPQGRRRKEAQGSPYNNAGAFFF